MFQVAANVIERGGGWIILGLFGLMFAGLLYAMNAEVDRMREQAAVSRAQLVKARDLWLSECKKPLDECAAAWDDGGTLRSLYRARILSEEDGE